MAVGIGMMLRYHDNRNFASMNVGTAAAKQTLIGSEDNVVRNASPVAVIYYV
jgi:hypothetical protein